VADYNPEHKAVLDDLLPGHPGVRAGKMFDESIRHVLAQQEQDAS
jgi:hypothetical protein